mmetsp:Transcript_16080/g.21627  ORF Transcript_16080/g.21627 Transcript_16080/m.21627 type:complete len:86 (+) Transcript_16080:1-258(+)
MLRFVGRTSIDASSERWAASSLHADLLDEESGEPLGHVRFDFQLTGFSLVMRPLGVERFRAGTAIVGIRRSHFNDLLHAVDWRNR